MKCFHCNNCGNLVFFENERCLSCGDGLGFIPHILEMCSQTKWPTLSSPDGGSYRHCANREQYDVCNWLVSDKEDTGFCLACKMSEIVPDLTIPGNRERWYRLELAKRRCLYTFLQLGLPLKGDEGAGHHSLRFRFLGDIPNAAPVLTGHDNGVITINIAEADADERERRRLTLHEPYRTLVGHIRHESGHYYWDRLVANSKHLPGFRKLFGDESSDYDAALKQYYQNGPANDWAAHMVTAYASLHPWEDWAETWAHYLHIVDTSDTAASYGLGLNQGEGTNGKISSTVGTISGAHPDFEALMKNWLPLTCALNSLNRGMGLADLYPFVTPPPVIDKLRFIHDLIQSESTLATASRVSNHQDLQTAG
jgi:hypothetical protein